MNKVLATGACFYASLALLAALPATAEVLGSPQGVFPMNDPTKIAQARSEPLPLPRDPDVAVQEEFDAARAAGTAKGWELFIARHGDHRLAAEAVKELGKLKQKSGG